MAKPDNRADNVEHLQQHLNDTMENIRETRDYLDAHGDAINPQDAEALSAKNRRRERAIDGFRAEIKDEARQQD